MGVIDTIVAHVDARHWQNADHVSIRRVEGKPHTHSAVCTCGWRLDFSGRPEGKPLIEVFENEPIPGLEP